MGSFGAAEKTDFHCLAKYLILTVGAKKRFSDLWLKPAAVTVGLVRGQKDVTLFLYMKRH